MFGRTSKQVSGAVILGVQDSPAGMQAVREAAHVAQRERKALHLVATYDLNDSQVHRSARTHGPADVAYAMSPKGDAESVLADALELIERLGLEVHTHVARGSLRAAVRTVTRKLADAPTSAVAPSPAAAPAARKPVMPRVAGRVGSAPRFPVPAPVPAMRFRRDADRRPAASPAADGVLVGLAPTEDRHLPAASN